LPLFTLTPNKIPFYRIALATIIMSLATSSIVSIDSSIPTYGQMMSSNQQDIPPMGVKITSPSNDEEVAIGNNTSFKVTGSSTDNTNANCNVSVILNNVKPYQEAVPTGPGGKGDYSIWNYELTPSYNATIKEGQNKITSKLSCPNPNENSSYDLVTHYSVFFAGVDSSKSISKTSPSVNTTGTTATSTSVSQQEQQEAQQKLSPSIATLVSPSQDNETIIQPSDSTSSGDDSVNNAKDEAATSAAPETSESSSSTSTSTIAATPTTSTTGTSAMTFTIYQEGRLEPSNIAKQDKTTTQTQSVGSPASSTPTLQEVSCDQNLPISSFSAIGDDGDDALPQNAFDNDLDTRWSHDSMGSWIIVDVGTIREICSVDIAWYRGDERSYDFIISLSNDGTNFKDLFEGTSRGDTLSPERYKVTDSVSTEGGGAAETPVSARYVKITINGNSNADTEENQWGALTEVDINGRQSGNENISTVTQTQINSIPSPITSEASSTPSAATESIDTMRMQISGSYEHEQNSKDSSPRPPRLDPSRLEGTIAFIDSTTNKKIAEYDLAPINITFTQAMKKITVKSGIDDPIKNGNVTSTLKFSSPIDVQKGGTYTSNFTATEPVTTIGSAGSNVLLAKISGEQTFLTRENTAGNIVIRSP
jgi:hypothetical protein